MTSFKQSSFKQFYTVPKLYFFQSIGSGYGVETKKNVYKSVHGYGARGRVSNSRVSNNFTLYLSYKSVRGYGAR